MCIYILTYMYIYIYIYVCVYICMYVYMYIVTMRTWEGGVPLEGGQLARARLPYLQGTGTTYIDIYI